MASYLQKKDKPMSGFNPRKLHLHRAGCKEQNQEELLRHELSEKDTNWMKVLSDKSEKNVKFAIERRK